MAYKFTTTPWILELEDGTQRQVPTSWPDLTMKAYAKLLSDSASTDIYGLLAAACSCTRMELLNLNPATGTAVVELLGYLSAKTPELGGWPLPDVVHIPGLPDATGYVEVKEVPVPKSLVAESFGQSVDLASALQEFGQDFGELRRQALAIYLLPKYYGCAYDTDLLPGMLEAVDRVRLGEGLPVADFFMLSLAESRPNTKPSSTLYPSLLQSKKQGTRNLAKLGRPTLWQRLWLEGISSKWGRYLHCRWGTYLRRSSLKTTKPTTLDSTNAL
jgi:hypothetical protein